MCTPTTCSGSIRPSNGDTTDPVSPPCAPYRPYPSRLINTAQALAIRSWFQPGCSSGTEKPCPGTDGATTWNASAGSAPYDRGSVSGPMISRNSATEPGQPWVRINGSASGSGERACRKWIGWSSMRLRYCG